MQFHPREFNLFQNLQDHFHLIQCALGTLRGCTEGAVDAQDAFARIQDLERAGDEILRNAIRQLDRQLTEYPPRADTRRMFHQQDRILDATEHLAGRLAAYGLGALPDTALRFIVILESCAEHLSEAIRAFGDARHFVYEMGKIADLENEADQLYIAALRDLTATEGDPRRLLMLHEVYGMFEKIANLFEDCIQAMQDSALKTLAGL